MEPQETQQPYEERDEAEKNQRKKQQEDSYTGLKKAKSRRNTPVDTRHLGKRRPQARRRPKEERKTRQVLGRPVCDRGAIPRR